MNRCQHLTGGFQSIPFDPRCKRKNSFETYGIKRVERLQCSHLSFFRFSFCTLHSSLNGSLKHRFLLVERPETTKPDRPQDRPVDSMRSIFVNQDANYLFQNPWVKYVEPFLVTNEITNQSGWKLSKKFGFLEGRRKENGMLCFGCRAFILHVQSKRSFWLKNGHRRWLSIPQIIWLYFEVNPYRSNNYLKNRICNKWDVLCFIVF